MVGPVRAGGLFEGGGTVWNTWKKGGTEKKGGETQILKSGGQAVSRGGCLKGMGGWGGWGGVLEPPFKLCMVTF